MTRLVAGHSTSRDREVSIERQMGSRVVIVVEVGSQDSLQVELVENDNPVQTLPTNGSDHAFAIRILPGCSRCDRHFVDPHALDAFPEKVSVDAISVSDHVARDLVEGKRFGDLLSRPLGRGMGGDIEVNDATTIVAQHDETVKHAECGRWHGEEVNAD